MSEIKTKIYKDEFGEEIEILISDNCCYCSSYEQDEEYRTCNLNPQMSNLKGFPFKKRLKCFKPDEIRRESVV